MFVSIFLFSLKAQRLSLGSILSLHVLLGLFAVIPIPQGVKLGLRKKERFSHREIIS
jgi:hypothetical protein